MKLLNPSVIKMVPLTHLSHVSESDHTSPPSSVLWHIAKWDFLALLQGVSGLIHQDAWLFSFPYTGTKRWLQCCEIWEGTPWRPLGATLCSWVEFSAKVPEQVANPAGPGCAPQLGSGVPTEPGCCWRAGWAQEEKHSFQWWLDLGLAPFGQKGSKAATLLCSFKAVHSDQRRWNIFPVLKEYF